jgi:bilirubin oxidase
MTQGREAIVRFINHAEIANSVHLHGSFSRAPFDGWADDITQPGQYKDYYYPNAQNARTLWYHDHAVDHTAENAYFGQAGFYILHDDQELGLGLPQGKYDIPLGLAAKRFNPDGTLWDPELNQETTSLYGDVFMVNGQPWPHLDVEPRRYRFRFLNTGISRTYRISFEDPNGVPQKFKMIGSDAGLLLNPVEITSFDMSIAERWEAMFDFTSFAGKNITLKNARQVAADQDFAATDRIMQFRVGTTVTDQAGNAEPPSPLRSVPFPVNKGQVDRKFLFERKNGQWEVNGITWSNVAQRVLAKPQRGATEVWELQNGGGGWSHPIHIHLVDFQPIFRSGGRGAVQPYEAVALKDVVWLGPSETVRVIARYAPWEGLYMFHCHNLIHEDHEMLAAFNVTVLEDLGYTDKTRFIDPMEPRYQAKAFPDSDFTGRTGDFSDSAIAAKVNFFDSLDAYAHVDDAEAALVAYWATHTGVAATGTSTTAKTTSTSTSTTAKTTSTTSTATKTKRDALAIAEATAFAKKRGTMFQS